MVMEDSFRSGVHVRGRYAGIVARSDSDANLQRSGLHWICTRTCVSGRVEPLRCKASMAALTVLGGRANVGSKFLHDRVGLAGFGVRFAQNLRLKLPAWLAIRRLS